MQQRRLIPPLSGLWMSRSLGAPLPSSRGLSQGRNKSVTSGIDLNLPEYGRLRPSLEVRATAPYDRGVVDAQKSVLGGVRVEMLFGRAHPYADFLVGRGRLTFDRPYTLPDTGAFVFSEPARPYCLREWACGSI
jgi:hypothetical protein